MDIEKRAKQIADSCIDEPNPSHPYCVRQIVSPTRTRT